MDFPTEIIASKYDRVGPFRSDFIFNVKELMFVSKVPLTRLLFMNCDALAALWIDNEIVFRIYHSVHVYAESASGSWTVLKRGSQVSQIMVAMHEDLYRSLPSPALLNLPLRNYD